MASKSEEYPQYLDVGNGHYVNSERVVAIAVPHGAAIKRAIKQAASDGLLLDFTLNLALKGVIVTDTGVLIKIAKRPVDVLRVIDRLRAI